MASEQVNVRVPDDELTMLDDLAGALARERAGNVTPTISRGDAVRLAIREAHERRAEQITADRAAWDALVAIAGPAALLTLHGQGEGEPLPEERAQTTLPGGRTATAIRPALWPCLAVIATVDGKPVDLPLRVEEPAASDLHADVILTDRDGRARIHLGPLSRIVEGHPAYFDRRLHSLADELHLS
jgi:Arc/MetJ-type ribon-helix-helix transcriptional regulator